MSGYNLLAMEKKRTKSAGISEKVISLLDIYTLIARNAYPSVYSLKEKLEVSERTVYRYLEIINMIDSIEFDKEHKGYKFSHGSRLKKLELSEDDVKLLLTLGETVSHLGRPVKNSFSCLV